MDAHYTQHFLQFKRPSGTSRGVLTQKETYLLHLSDGHRQGVGECALFRGLSYDDVPHYEQKLQWLCENIHLDQGQIQRELKDFPSLYFGYEQAMLNLQHGGDIYFPNAFSSGEDSIRINGLIWMGSAGYMKQQIEEKLSQNFTCIKLKIGVNWAEEREILQELRKTYPQNTLELRVDANGAFSPQGEAQRVLAELADLGIHSIEQPIKAGQWQEMARLCQETPTPIALDEELIGLTDTEQRIQCLEAIKPQYIILKPALVGGFSACDEWISLAEERRIGWWLTSALESNIGLNAIAQYTYSKHPKIPQGLGTGGLFAQNFPIQLRLSGDKLSRN